MATAPGCPTTSRSAREPSARSIVSRRNSRYLPLWMTRESTRRSASGSSRASVAPDPSGPVAAAPGPSGSVIVTRRGAASGGGRDALGDERGARLRVEQVQLRRRQVQREDVVRLDPVLRVDDRDDVLLGRRDVEQLLVPEVLDDIGAALELADLGVVLLELQMLGPEADDDLLAGRQR